MKALVLALTLINVAPALAAASHEEIDSKSLISVNSLRCEIAFNGSQIPVNERTTTALGNEDRELAIVVTDKNKNILKLKHKIARAQGCDVANLDAIARESNHRFSFVDVNIKVIQDVSESRINGFNECVAILNEKVILDFGQDITLTSQEGQLIKATDCAKP
jgi:hypothetical protein